MQTVTQPGERVEQTVDDAWQVVDAGNRKLQTQTDTQ